MSPAVEWRPLAAADGHRWDVLLVRPAEIRRTLVWLPALGVAAKHYEPFGRELALHGIATCVHEWRGLGTSSLRAGRTCDWGYRELIESDIPRTLDLARGDTRNGPVIIGGHSLGGQLASCTVALHRDTAQALWLVASGAPYFRAFSLPKQLWLPGAYHLLALLARAHGALPGRRLGFGGQEARSVIRDWSRTGLTGRYAVPGVENLEQRLRDVDVAIDSVLLADDWLAPRSSLDFLLSKMNSQRINIRVLGEQALGVRADHFAWMRHPSKVVESLLAVRGWDHHDD